MRKLIATVLAAVCVASCGHGKAQEGPSRSWMSENARTRTEAKEEASRGYGSQAKITDTVLEYMERGKEWAKYMDSIRRKDDAELSQYTTQDTEVLTLDIQDDGMVYYGTMELTAYIWTGNPCADGVYPEAGYTVACNDPALWHKWIYIEGMGYRYVHDTGGMANDVIDVYVGDYETAVLFGRWSSNVYVLKESEE